MSDDIVSIANAEIEMFERPSVATSKLLIKKLEAADQINKEMREALEHVINVIEESDAWWIGDPNRGGIDENMVTKALANARGEL